MSKKILILKGDGIGPEIVAEAVKVLACLQQEFGLDVELEQAEIGGCAYEKHGQPLPENTLRLARAADALLLGAVGGPQWESLDISVRPEQGLLGLRSELSLFANLRPAILFPQLTHASTLKKEVVSGLNLMIVRELTGGIYFGQPRGIRTLDNGEKEGYNTLIYKESEIKRIVQLAFDIAMQRNKSVVSVDKANVLEATELWRSVANEVAQHYPQVEIKHMYVDNAVMQLVKAPKQFDVIVTTNMFGDILSDCAAMLTGSIGMLPSASLDGAGKGMYEPIHGSAPHLTGKNIANPLATILSIAMMLKYSVNQPTMAETLEFAINDVLNDGWRTKDIYTHDMRLASTTDMGDAVVKALMKQSK